MTFRATVGGTDVVRCEGDARSDLQGHRIIMIQHHDLVKSIA